MTASRHLAHGFTLIEMIIVIVILSIASVAVVAMVSRLNSGQAENSDLQVGAQLAQECGEWIVSNHRRDESFFDSILVVGTSASCFGGTGAYGGFSAPSVTVTDHTGGTGCPPSPAVCKLAAITMTKSGASLNTMHVMVVKYN